MHPEEYIPITQVSGLLFAKDGDVLLYRSSFLKGHYSLPLGAVHLGETREAAFQRVVHDGFGLEIEHVRYAFTIDSIFSDEYFKKSHFVIHEYVADLTEFQDKNAVRLLSDQDAHLWVPPQFALDLLLTKESKIMIEWYLREKK
jgi:ADP-ribose pyrophosphatase YjhB (NUDIX family)